MCLIVWIESDSRRDIQLGFNWLTLEVCLEAVLCINLQLNIQFVASFVAWELTDGFLAFVCRRITDFESSGLVHYLCISQVSLLKPSLEREKYPRRSIPDCGVA